MANFSGHDDRKTNQFFARQIAERDLTRDAAQRNADGLAQLARDEARFLTEVEANIEFQDIVVSGVKHGSSKISLSGAVGLGGDELGRRSVEFIITPELNESRNINYAEISEMRQAGGLLIYVGTSARTYQISGRMLSRTSLEADSSYNNINRLKGWTVPNKGGNSGGGIVNNERNAPEVLRLSGYSTMLDKGAVRGVPVVITSLSIEYPSTVSYIPTTDGKTVMPVIQNVTIGLKEARSPTDLRTFDLGGFRAGILPYW